MIITLSLAFQICEAFGANRYPFPEEVPRQRQMHAEVTSRLRELHTTIEAGDMLRQTVLTTVAQSKQALLNQRPIHRYPVPSLE